MPNCSFMPVGYHSICLMHIKQSKMKAMSILGKIKGHLGSKWDSFLEILTQKAAQGTLTDKNTDGISIDFTFFD